MSAGHLDMWGAHKLATSGRSAGCASCKGLYPKLSKMCEENPQIVIAKINFEENKELAKKLGVKVCTR
jgi:thiol-disulfide isomerase/thioredoxin